MLKEENASEFLIRLGINGKLWAEEMHKKFPSIPEEKDKRISEFYGITRKGVMRNSC